MLGRLLWIDRATNAGTQRELTELPALMADETGWLWLDIPEPDDEAAAVLRDVFKAHPAARMVVSRRSLELRSRHG